MIKNCNMFGCLFVFYEGIFYWTVTETGSVHLYKENRVLHWASVRIPCADQPCSQGGTADIPGSLQRILPVT